MINCQIYLKNASSNLCTMMSVVGGLLHALSVKPRTAFSSAMCLRNNKTRSEWGITWGIFENKSAAPRRPFSKSIKKPDNRASCFQKKKTYEYRVLWDAVNITYSFAFNKSEMLKVFLKKVKVLNLANQWLSGQNALRQSRR